MISQYITTDYMWSVDMTRLLEKPENENKCITKKNYHENTLLFTHIIIACYYISQFIPAGSKN